MSNTQLVKVFLVNGESRSLRLTERTDVNEMVQYILNRLRVNMDIAFQLFGIQLKHLHSNEAYWLQPGYTVQELLHEYCGMRPLNEWRFLLRIRVLPKTPQHLQSQDPISFQYFYDQVLHTYLESEEVRVDNDAAVKLGCLELRRFYKDMPQIALKKRENFTMLERDIGLEKFFKKSLLSSVKKKNLRGMVLNAFQQYETLTMEGCMFQFFNLLSKQHPIDTEKFTNCAVGGDHSIPLTYDIYVGANCDVEFKPDRGERRFLAAFNEIQDISFEVELMSRGKVILDMKNNLPSVVIRTALLSTAIDLSSLIDAYCMVYTPNPHSRMTGAPGKKRYSNSSRYSSSAYSSVNDDDRFQQPIPVPYATFRRSTTEYPGLEVPESGEYATVHEPESPLFGAHISPLDIDLQEKIGEGQFGDVHKGILYPNTNDEVLVAIKTCKPDAPHDDKAKFLEEAAVMCKFNHPHIIKLFGVMVQESHTYIVMELAPLGQLRRYLLTEGSRVSKLQLLEFIHQLSSAMVHLESKNYVHRDIAARNLLVANPRVVKLADFGLSRGLEETDYYVASPGKLPIKWMAPESINFRRFTGSSDVWMFGVCCWEILMRGVKPFVGIKNDEVINKIENGERLAIPVECPAPLFRLMNVCWEYDPQERPPFRDIEGAISVIIEEERELDKMTQRRVYAGVIQPDLNAPEKPPRGPGISRTPSDSNVKRLSTVSHTSEANRRLSANIDTRDDNPLPLPPRAIARFRDFSVSPPQPGDPRLSPSNGMTPPPNKPPRSVQHHHHQQHQHNPGWSEYPPDPRLDHPPPLPIEPYSVTTISAPEEVETHMSSNSRSSESPLPPSLSGGIPPPSIIRQPRRQLSSGSDVYYSTPAEIAERGAGRMLNEEGVFVDRDREMVHTSHSSLDSKDHGLRPKLGESRPISHVSTENSSPRSSPVFDDRNATGGDDDFKPKEDDSIVQQTTVVVKAVMELSNKVPLSRPTDYVELVKNVGLSLRDLLMKVDALLKELPPQTHTEVSMAHKVLSSDMSQLVEAMKNAQKHYQTFLEQDYQKQMLKAAHIVAVNSKLLLDAVNSARRKAHLMQR